MLHRPANALFSSEGRTPSHLKSGVILSIVHSALAFTVVVVTYGGRLCLPTLLERVSQLKVISLEKGLHTGAKQYALLFFI